MIYRNHNLLIILLLLVFVGQASAANAMLCKMNFQGSASASTMDHSKMNQAMSEMEQDSDSDSNTQMTGDCCKSNGNCSMSGCIVVAAVPIKIEISTPEIFVESISSSKVLTTIKIPPSLFRPPITA
jgi:hypothetical protein